MSIHIVQIRSRFSFIYAVSSTSDFLKVPKLVQTRLPLIPQCDGRARIWVSVIGQVNIDIQSRDIDPTWMERKTNSTVDKMLT